MLLRAFLFKIELWMQGENRPIFIVKNEEDWKSLLQIKDAGNIYIPWFYSNQIVAIPNNTNIFVFTERVPSFIKGEITLRPRTYSTISASLPISKLPLFGKL